MQILDSLKLRLDSCKRAWMGGTGNDYPHFARSYQYKMRIIKWFLMILLFFKPPIFLPIMGKKYICALRKDFMVNYQKRSVHLDF